MEMLSILICLFCMITDGLISALTVNEGDDAELAFHCNDPDVEISLSFGEGEPFYKNGGFVNSELNIDQPNRYDRYSVDTKTPEDTEGGTRLSIVTFKITNARKEDANTIVCKCDKSGVNVNTERETLSVLFPPGNASCTHDPTDQYFVRYDPWVVLTCAAFFSNIPASIICYQNGMRVPPFERLDRNKTHMIQKVWMTKTELVCYCSSPYEDMKDMDSCTQYLWEPDEQSQVLPPRSTTAKCTDRSSFKSTDKSSTPLPPLGSPHYYTTDSEVINNCEHMAVALNVLIGAITFAALVMTF